MSEVLVAPMSSIKSRVTTVTDCGILISSWWVLRPVAALLATYPLSWVVVTSNFERLRRGSLAGVPSEAAVWEKAGMEAATRAAHVAITRRRGDAAQGVLGVI